ncbi:MULTISPECIES: hypothetical protein [Kocuria]|uniref:Uncharacterized protein n=1 Tax=Kocuria oceani TaxID=988827 RepID=A0ABV9TK27_9MICC|nr:MULTISPECIES: hypothetical protein [Kocuria]
MTHMRKNVTAPARHQAPLAEELRVPFWIVLAGVGAGALWALAGVVVGSWVRSRGLRARGAH